MSSKRLVPIVALLLLASALAIVGFSQTQQVLVPPGAIVESPNAQAGDAGAPRPDVPDAPKLPASSALVTFADEFASGNLDNWDSLSTAQGEWAVQDGRLQQRGTDGDLIADEPAVLMAEDVTFGDGTFSAHVYSTSGSPVGVVFRGSDAGYYRVSLYRKGENSTPKAYLQKVEPNGIVEIARASADAWPGYEDAKWQLITVNATGSRIVLSVDGVQVLEATDAAFAQGWAGVWTFADMGAQFDNVRIQQTAGR